MKFQLSFFSSQCRVILSLSNFTEVDFMHEACCKPVVLRIKPLDQRDLLAVGRPVGAWCVLQATAVMVWLASASPGTW